MDNNIECSKQSEISEQLRDSILELITDIKKDRANERSYTPTIEVIRVGHGIVSDTIKTTLETENLKNPDSEWEVIEIDADKIASRLTGLPLEGNTMSKFGKNGILDIKGFNEKCYETLGANFDWNLIQDHYILGKKILKGWIVIIETDKKLEKEALFYVFS